MRSVLGVALSQEIGMETDSLIQQSSVGFIGMFHVPSVYVDNIKFDL